MQKHGLREHPLYRIWKSIKSRCFTVTDKSYFNYGGRGITICVQWKDDFLSFYNWSITNGYAKGLEIDREDNNGNYTPTNCRWTTRLVQANNKRNNRYYFFNGEKKTVPQIAMEVGINPGTLKSRLVRDGMCISEAVKLPNKKGDNTCWKGHVYTYENTYMRPDGKRECRICRKRHVENMRSRSGTAGRN